MNMTDEDYALALQLQSHLFEEDENNQLSGGKQSHDVNKPMSLVDPYWELTDPNPDMRALFLEFNNKYFWGSLAGVEVKWSSRMTVCAGICRYEGRGGLCSIGLSVPLLKLRPRKDLIETLLHEMIHAYLFVTDNNKDHDGHGPEFHKHMYRLNKETGTNISVYHNFHDEVEVYKQHWWRCDGPCQNRKPYFGYVKRSMNRAPSKNDLWWAEHQRSCGGSYTKIKEPEGYGKKKTKADKAETSNDKAGKTGVKSMDIRIFGGEGKTLGKPKTSGSVDDNTGKVKSTPTATITSGVLSRQNTDNIGIGKQHEEGKKGFDKDNMKDKSGNRKITSFLPGATTPTKPVRNKPVSQGGNVPFNKVKKKVKLPVIDFSDSDDDDLLAAVPSPVVNPNLSSGSVTGETVSDKDDPGAANTIANYTNTPDNVQEGDFDANDVRAMLRKVWGQKQIVPNKTLTTLDSKNIKPKGAFITGQKREPADSNIDIIPNSKRIKLNSDNERDYRNDSVSSVVSTNNKTQKSPNRNTPKSNVPKVTSPIEKLFNNIRDRQTHDNQAGVIVRSISDEIVRPTPTCDSLTVIPSDDTNNDTSVCPVCNKSVPITSINDHLDLCLTLQAIA